MIEGAFRVLDDFEAVDASTEAMKALTLERRRGAGVCDGRAGAALRRADAKGQPPAPVTAEQLVEARRPGGPGAQPLDDLPARPGERDARRPARSQHAGTAACARGQVGSIDRGVSLNRALWMLAEEMRKLKA